MKVWIRRRGAHTLRARCTARDAERGSVLVEFGLALPILVTLILGGISTGLAYNTNNTLNNSAREAARFAATLPVEGDLNAWLDTIADAALFVASGGMDPTVPDQRLCIAYVHPNGSSPDDRTVALVESSGSRNVLVGQTCFDDGRPADEPRVQVQLSRTTDVEAAVFSRQVSLQARSLVRFERSGS